MSLTRMISLASDSKIAPLTISRDSGDNRCVKNSKARAARVGVLSRPFAIRIFANGFEAIHGNDCFCESLCRRASRGAAIDRNYVAECRCSAACVDSAARSLAVASRSVNATHLIEPAQRIFLVVERDGCLGQLERVLRVEHHRQLFGARARSCSP